MLGDVIELSIVVKDLEVAVKQYETLFDLKVYKRNESKEYGFKAAILPLGKGHIELLESTDPSKAIGRFLATHGEGVYLVGFETEDIPGSVKKLRERAAKVAHPSPDAPVAWVHPKDTHGVYVELRKTEQYT